MFTRQIIEKFAGIKDQSVVGVRAPYLRVGGDKQFKWVMSGALYTTVFTL